MKNASLVTFLLFSSMSLSAQKASLHADASPPAEAEIKALEVKLAGLVVHGDWDEYESHLASDFLRTRENGQVENKDEAMASLRDVKQKIIVMEMEPADVIIRSYGDTTVSSAEFTIRVRENGQVKSRRTRLSDVFVKHDGQWWLVAEQGSTIGK
jgi:ketosteroid isomerase-like protein